MNSEFEINVGDLFIINPYETDTVLHKANSGWSVVSPIYNEDIFSVIYIGQKRLIKNGEIIFVKEWSVVLYKNELREITTKCLRANSTIRITKKP